MVTVWFPGTPDGDHLNKQAPLTHPPLHRLQVGQAEASWRRDRERLTQNQIQFQPNGRRGRHTGRLRHSCQDTSMTGRQTAAAATQRDTQTTGHTDTTTQTPGRQKPVHTDTRTDTQTPEQTDTETPGQTNTRTDTAGQTDRQTLRRSWSPDVP